MTLSITIGALGIASDPTTGLWLDDVAIVLPSFGIRTRVAQDSDVHPGSTLLAYTTAIDEIQFAVYATGADQAALAVKMAALETAMLDVTSIVVTEHGVATTYTDRWPAVPRWDGVRSQIHDVFTRRAACVIPINPT